VVCKDHPYVRQRTKVPERFPSTEGGWVLAWVWPGSGRGSEAVASAAHGLQAYRTVTEFMAEGAGPTAVRQLAGDVGFSRFRQVTHTPVNIVLELRP